MNKLEIGIIIGHMEQKSVEERYILKLKENISKYNTKAALIISGMLEERYYTNKPILYEVKKLQQMLMGEKIKEMRIEEVTEMPTKYFNRLMRAGLSKIEDFFKISPENVTKIIKLTNEECINMLCVFKHYGYDVELYEDFLREKIKSNASYYRK